MKKCSMALAITLALSVWNCNKRAQVKPVRNVEQNKTSETSSPSGDKQATEDDGSDTNGNETSNSEDSQRDGVMTFDDHSDSTTDTSVPDNVDMSEENKKDQDVDQKMDMEKDLYLVNLSSNKCMTPSPLASSYENGHLVKQIECSDLSIKWSFNGDGTIRHVASGLCLTPMDGKEENGTPLRLWACNEFPHQKWLRELGSSGQYQLKGEASGRCLTPSENGLGNDTPQRLWECKADFTHQTWKMQADLPPDSVDIASILETHGYFSSGNGCIVPNLIDTPAIFTNGHLLGQKPCSEDHHPLLIAKGDGTIRHIGSGLCLTPQDGDIADGTRVRLWECRDDFPHQIWRIEKNEDRFQIVNRKSGTCLNWKKNEQADIQIEIKSCDSNLESQKWNFTKQMFVKNASSNKCMARDTPDTADTSPTGLLIKQYGV